jgi:heme exporter protein C
LGYFLVRRSTANPEQGKRFAAVIGVIGVLDIPLIHVSVTWLRSLHPEAVILNPDSPMNLDGSMGATLSVGLLAFSLIFASLFLARYSIAGYEHQLDLRDASAVTPQGAEA